MSSATAVGGVVDHNHLVRAGAAVDAIRAASALALVSTHHHPRLTALNVASAGAFALLGATLVRRIGR